MTRSRHSAEHEAFRSSVRTFLEREVVPHYAAWEEAGRVPREIYPRVAQLGLMGMAVPEEHGGSGVEDTFLFSVVWTEECSRAGVNLGGVTAHTNLVVPYFLALADAEQSARWLPGMAAGHLMGSIAMTEPGTGSDLSGMRTRAVRDGDHYVLDGSKTFISGGLNAHLVVVVARTSDAENPREGLSLLVVEEDMEGFERGRNLDKLGLHANDTAELFFDGVRVPVANRLGEEGKAFEYLRRNLVQERLGIAVNAQVSAETALRLTVDYVKERKAFGTPISSFQNTKFELASCRTEIAAGRALVDQSLDAHVEGRLDPPGAAMTKLFCTEMQNRVIDRCLQLHGGYGYMREYRIARMYADARVTRIYGGTSEVQRLVIAKSLGL